MSEQEPRVIRIRLWAELAAIFLLLSELVWIGAFYNAISRDQAPFLKIFTVLGLVILISHYLARALNVSTLEDRPRRIIFISWLVLALFGSMRLLVLAGKPVGLLELFYHPFFGITRNETESFAEFWHLVLVAILIWRGISKAREPVSVVSALRSFQLGLLAFIVFGVVMAPRQPENRTILYLGAYLFLGLLAMTLARIAVVSELRGGKIGKFSRQWLAGVAGAALLLVTVTLGVGLLLRQPLSFAIQNLAFALFWLLSLVVLALTYPLLWLINLLAPLFRQITNNIPALTIFNDLQNMVNRLAIEQNNLLEEYAAPAAVGRQIGRLALIAFLLFIIVVALRWKPAPRRPAGEEDVADIRGRFRFPHLPDLNPRRVLYRITHAGRLLAAARIRQIYTELTDLSAALGAARPPAATPSEYLPTLLAIFPQNGPALTLLTTAYEKIRYGELPESPREVQEAEAAWALVRAEGRQLLSNRRSKTVNRTTL